MECLCGSQLPATTDSKLSEQARGEHVDGYHPELRLGYERLGQFVARFAYDEQFASSSL